MRMVTDGPVKLGRKQHYRSSFSPRDRFRTKMPRVICHASHKIAVQIHQWSYPRCLLIEILLPSQRSRALGNKNGTRTFMWTGLKAIGVTLPVRRRAGMAPRKSFFAVSGARTDKTSYITSWTIIPRLIGIMLAAPCCPVASTQSFGR